MPSHSRRREHVEAASSPALERLARVRPLVVAVLVGTAVVTALAVGSRWSALALLPVVALLAWLAYLAWPRLRPAERAVRLFVLGALLTWCVVTLVSG
jgi:hypothetical protein